jgi:hypothetical protein
MRKLLALAILCSACSKPGSAPRAPAEPAAPTAPTACATVPTEIGRIQDEQLDEVSGVAESTRNPAVLFVHNDSGDSPRFFAVNRRGELLAELALPSVPKLLDAEDIAIGRGPGGRSFIYLGDTGNNLASNWLGIPRRKAVVYRIPEPEIPSSARQLKMRLPEAFPIVFTFPRGTWDIEALFVDPISGELFLITKQPDGHSQLLVASAAQLAGGGGKLTFLGELRFGRKPLAGSTMPTSAAISKDGSAILVRTYSSVFLFTRGPGESVLSALSKAPQALPSAQEPQGEAISFVDRDSAFVSISEGARPALNCSRLERMPNTKM